MSNEKRANVTPARTKGKSFVYGEVGEAIGPGQQCTLISGHLCGHKFAAHIEPRWTGMKPGDETPFGPRCPYVEPTPSTSPGLPPAREVAHGFVTSCLRGRRHNTQDLPHSDDCDRLTTVVETDRRAR